jgi:enoyl-CoA hydratase
MTDLPDRAAPGELLVETRGAVGVVTLSRPARRNALTPQLHQSLVAAVGELDGDTSVAAIVITGADPAFCAGVDLASLARGERFVTPVEGQLGPLPPTATPLVAAVNGPAMTGGLELVLACDLVIASDRATFADTHARVGVVPGWGMSVLLPRMVGAQRAALMTLTGRTVDAATAAMWGLVAEVVPHDGLLDAAVGIGEAMAAGVPEAVQELLALHRRSIAADTDAAWRLEAEVSRAWWRDRLDPAAIAERAPTVIREGRAGRS